MSDLSEKLKGRLSEAVRHFWSVREKQASKQGGADAAAKDRGARGAVTGGKHIDGFIRLVCDLLVESGLSGATIYCKPRAADEAPAKRKKRAQGGPPPNTKTVLPGWFRPEKDWDLLVILN